MNKPPLHERDEVQRILGPRSSKPWRAAARGLAIPQSSDPWEPTLNDKYIITREDVKNTHKWHAGSSPMDTTQSTGAYGNVPHGWTYDYHPHRRTIEL